MKILQVTKTFKPFWEFGGAARASYEMTRHLSDRGHEITVYTTDGFSSIARVESNKLIDVDGLRTYYFNNVLRYFPGHLEIISPGPILNIIKKNINNFDLIHFHSLRTSLTVVTAYYAKKNNIPYVLQPRGAVLPFFQKQKLKKIFDLCFGYEILRNASKVIALTKTEVEQCKKMGVDNDKIEIVPNGIDLSEYANLPEKGEFRKKYGIKSNEKIVLYLGRMHIIKGIDLLVEAFSDLVRELDDVKLVIAGPDDGFLSTLKSQIGDLKIGDRILFTGPLYERDKLEAYIDADIYVLPSVYETFPNTVLEACACGTPVIVTDRCGIANIVEKIGCVVEYDKDQLRDAIIKVLSDEGLRRRFGEDGRRLVGKEFSWDKVVRKIEGIYEKTIKVC